MGYLWSLTGLFLCLQGLEKILDQHMVKVWNDLYSLTDKYTDGWLSSGILICTSFSLIISIVETLTSSKI